ncbi:hypothetical protein A3Q56_03804 [Intoshia linei]|uniref:Uncharacterized protein n=1 Tax=Intoshia linei TaxID=1819745 RepID=A0A177B4D5_9BILA|nr:hypothetical protein A3Q56_03804 [Intoshia linei]
MNREKVNLNRLNKCRGKSYGMTTDKCLTDLSFLPQNRIIIGWYHYLPNQYTISTNKISDYVACELHSL